MNEDIKQQSSDTNMQATARTPEVWEIECEAAFEAARDQLELISYSVGNGSYEGDEDLL